eukprot:TRINITY_DN5712_c1_g1_i4.p3 TRINITY_DN5712_c1_g1~~TRINITY_DN5712_c1_g1_i4.p3  ORF type:complete len:352 (+),score=40.60 TRINITY_DN5712_c1_g1_i4:82-1056(+)
MMILEASVLISLLYSSRLAFVAAQAINDNSTGSSISTILIPGFQAVRWDEARKICQEQYNGNLVVIDSEPKNIEVYNFVQCLMGEGKVWIGLTDLLSEGIYRKDSGNLDVAGFAKWYQDQPSDQEGLENCVELGVGFSVPFDRYWNDEICSTKNTFVCEADSKTFSNVQIPQNLSGSECWNMLERNNSEPTRKFEVVPKLKTWMEAEMYCTEVYQGHLASVKNPIEQQIMYWIVKQALEDDNIVWIGGNDLIKEGEFLWVGDGSKIQDVEFWANVQPDNIQYEDGVNENCIEMFVGSAKVMGLDVNGQWVDSRCDLLRPFVCEY